MFLYCNKIFSFFPIASSLSLSLCKLLDLFKSVLYRLISALQSDKTLSFTIISMIFQFLPKCKNIGTRWPYINSSVTKQGESQNRCFKKKSTPNFPKNDHFLPPDAHTYVYVSGSKKCSFFGKFGVLFS